MPDTGQAAGQQDELAFCFTQYGLPLTFANAAAFEAAGWLLVYRAAQTTQAIVYSLAPHTDAVLAAQGWHLVVVTMINGQGPLIPRHSSGDALGYAASPRGYQLASESTDVDGMYSALLQSVGVATAATLIVTNDYTITEDDSFIRQITIYESAVTQWGFTAENLADGTLTLEAAVRAPGNRTGVPNGWMTVVPLTAVTGSNPILRLSWIDFPSVVATIQDGMDYSPSDDAEVATITFLYDAQFRVTKTIAVNGGNQAGKRFTCAADQRLYFSVGGKFQIAGSTGNDATYTCAALSYAAGTTTVTVVEAIPNATLNGNFTMTIRATIGDGSIVVRLQRTIA